MIPYWLCSSEYHAAGLNHGSEVFGDESGVYDSANFPTAKENRMSDNFKRKMQEIDAKIVTRFDQALQEFRLVYDNSNSAERIRLRDWLSDTEELVESGKEFWGILLRIRVGHSYSDAEGESVYEGSADFNPSVMVRAMDAWDKGEEFTPKGAFGTM